MQGGFCREAALCFASDLIAIGLRRMGAKKIYASPPAKNEALPGGSASLFLGLLFGQHRGQTGRFAAVPEVDGAIDHRCGDALADGEVAEALVFLALPGPLANPVVENGEDFRRG